MSTAPDPTPTAPEPEEHHDRGNRVLYLVVGLVLGALLVFGIVSFEKAENNQAAQAKARQLQATFRHAGLPVPADTKVLVRAFGDDGGPVCELAGNDLPGAILDQQLGTGTSGPGARPITADVNIPRAEFFVLATYCPKRVAAFVKRFKDYRFDSVIGGEPQSDTINQEINVIK